jgi:hypothetical protein
MVEAEMQKGVYTFVLVFLLGIVSVQANDLSAFDACELKYMNPDVLSGKISLEETQKRDAGVPLFPEPEGVVLCDYIEGNALQTSEPRDPQGGSWQILQWVLDRAEASGDAATFIAKYTATPLVELFEIRDKAARRDILILYRQMLDEGQSGDYITADFLSHMFVSDYRDFLILHGAVGSRHIGVLPEPAVPDETLARVGGLLGLSDEQSIAIGTFVACAFSMSPSDDVVNTEEDPCFFRNLPEVTLAEFRAIDLQAYAF